jgi:hypothetical protein
MEQFPDSIKLEWESAPAVTLRPMQQENKLRFLDENIAYVNHWHWRKVYDRTFVEVFDSSARKECFSTIKGIVLNEEKLQYNSIKWKAALITEIMNVFPLGDVVNNFDGDPYYPFWLTLGKIPPDAYEQYKNKKIFVFSEDANNRLALNNTNKQKWLKAFRLYYRLYWEKIFDIYLIVNPNDQNKPKYKIVRSLAIALDQRVFLVQDIQTETYAVVKWESETENALYFWKKARKTKMKMFHFETKYMLHPNQKVLIMEHLSKIDASDDLYRLLVDILEQLQAFHRGGLVHADIKLDNIMKRTGDKTEYFLIDFDSISYRPMEKIRNAVERISYSPLWTSQIPGIGAYPTSYRYDLEELFYAAGDLKKIQRRIASGNRYQIDEFTDAEFRWKNKFKLESIIRDIHSTKIIGDIYLTELFSKIMDLPERLPFEKIDHTELIEYVKLEMKETPSAPFQITCAICAGITRHPISSVNSEDQSIQVCSLRCSLLAKTDIHNDEAHAYRQVTKCLKKPKGCLVCGSAPRYRCDKCRLAYCSEKCYVGHEDHTLLCE